MKRKKEKESDRREKEEVCVCVCVCVCATLHACGFVMICYFVLRYFYVVVLNEQNKSDGCLCYYITSNYFSMATAKFAYNEKILGSLGLR